MHAAQPVHVDGAAATLDNAIVPDRPRFAPAVNAYDSDAFEQPANVTVAVPTGVVICVAGVSVSKIPADVSYSTTSIDRAPGL